jgi:hypothetical protein
MGDFPSSLSEPIPRADSEEEAYMREKEGSNPFLSASTAACDDD